MATTDDEIINCLKCHSRIKEFDKFCSKCGKELGEERQMFRIYNNALQKIYRFISIYPVTPLVIDKEEESIIPGIVADVCGAGFSGLPYKTMLFIGYYLRKAENEILNKDFLKTENQNIIRIV